MRKHSPSRAVELSLTFYSSAIPAAANQAIVSPASASSAPVDEAAVYASYIAAMDNPLTSASSDSVAAQPTFKVAAVIPASSASAATVDEAAVYNSYVAAMDAPTTGLWATYTPSPSSPVKV